MDIPDPTYLDARISRHAKGIADLESELDNLQSIENPDEDIISIIKYIEKRIRQFKSQKESYEKQRYDLISYNQRRKQAIEKYQDLDPNVLAVILKHHKTVHFSNADAHTCASDDE